MAKSLIIGMIVFDLFLHIWQWITGEYFVFWNGNYDLFWTGYFGLLLMLCVFELYLKKKNR